MMAYSYGRGEMTRAIEVGTQALHAEIAATISDDDLRAVFRCRLAHEEQ
jgi:hypothetical protein